LVVLFVLVAVIGFAAAGYVVAQESTPTTEEIVGQLCATPEGYATPIDVGMSTPGTAEAIPATPEASPIALLPCPDEDATPAP
ncbi:MAG TPA: hypothetical protein VKB09_12445, partial [Thermomicrobiales bacterium]|nr:hypothetical protein [Thermomicrobiales bacterium]